MTFLDTNDTHKSMTRRIRRCASSRSTKPFNMQKGIEDSAFRLQKKLNMRRLVLVLKTGLGKVSNMYSIKPIV